MSSNIEMRLASARVNATIYSDDEIPRLYTPGEVITEQQGFMRFA